MNETGVTVSLGDFNVMTTRASRLLGGKKHVVRAHLNLTHSTMQKTGTHSL